MGTEEISRREFLKVVSVACAGIIIGAGVGYTVAPPKTIEKTVTKTVTTTVSGIPSLTPTAKGYPWILVDISKCTGCKKCEEECAKVHADGVSRVSIVKYNEQYIPILCIQCTDPPCVAKCPVKALTVNAETGFVTVDTNKCIGCQLCHESCPGHVPEYHPERKYAIICDLCKGDPACVKVCPTGALTYVEVPSNYKEAIGSWILTVYSKVKG